MLAQGFKLNAVPHRDALIAADHYLSEHRAALMQEAMEIVQRSPTLLRMHERSLVRNSANLHSKQSAAAQGLPLCKSHDQNGALK